MKKLFIASLLLLSSCGKMKFENKIQGSWTLYKGKPNNSTEWYSFPSTEEPVVITDDFISNPWNKPYTISNKCIILDEEIIKVDVSKNDMLWVFENNDSLKFIR